MLKNLATLMVAMAGFTTISSAAIITCTPNDGSANVVTQNVLDGTPSIYTCDGRDAGAGNEIYAIAVRLQGSFNDDTEGTLHMVTFTGAGSANGATHSVTTEVGDLSGDDGGYTSGPFAPFGPGQTLAAGSTVSITWGFNALTIPTNATVTVRLETLERPIGEVPEPSTFALLGTALVGAGLIRRRLS